MSAPIRSRARAALAALVLVVATGATAACGDAGDGGDGGGGDRGGGGGAIVSYDPDGTGAGDVTGLELVEEAGATAARVTVTNSATVTMSYTISVAADAPDGSVRYGDTAVYVYELPAGQTTTVQEIFVGTIPDDAVPVIKDIESIASS